MFCLGSCFYYGFLFALIFFLLLFCWCCSVCSYLLRWHPAQNSRQNCLLPLIRQVHLRTQHPHSFFAQGKRGKGHIRCGPFSLFERKKKVSGLHLRKLLPFHSTAFLLLLLLLLFCLFWSFFVVCFFWSLSESVGYLVNQLIIH